MAESEVPADEAPTRPLSAWGAYAAIALCLVWGFNQVAVKLALPGVPPLTQAAIRALGAAGIVALFALRSGVPLTIRDGALRPGLATGVLLAVQFLLLYCGLVWTTASRAVLFLYAAPLFIALGARWAIPGNRFDLMQWAGVVLSFAGIVIAWLPAPTADPRQAVGDAMVLGAAVAWAAITLVLTASPLERVPPEKMLLYQFAVAGPLLALGALAFGERIVDVPSPLALGALFYQTVLVSGVSYLAWYALARRYPASPLSWFIFLIPFFGVAAGHLVLGERLSQAFMAGMAMVTGGLVLLSTRPVGRDKQ